MGFVKNAEITILSKSKNGVMIRILDSKLALDLALASKIFICESTAKNEMQNEL